MTQLQSETGVAGIDALREVVLSRIRAGDRFAGLFATAGEASRDEAGGDGDVEVTLIVATASTAGVQLTSTQVADAYPCLTADIPAAFWYERVLHDLFGIIPLGHPRLDPLVLPLPERPEADGDWRRLPRPGSPSHPARLVPDERAVPRHVYGKGLFTIPHGPVRSGVMESVEYLVETPGEDIPHLQVRIFAKHRGVERAFQGRTVDDGVLLAERAEGTSSVGHALAYSHAVEACSGTDVPHPAALVRVLHAELERIANHLDAAVKLADAAGLAVAVARFGVHKEHVMRLRSALCGNRFGRGVVVPGGVTSLPEPVPALSEQLARLRHDIRSDADALMGTSSFLDRIRTTGPLPPATARTHGALGPVARGSGFHDDCRVMRPYDAYPELSMLPAPQEEAGDAQARTRVRWHEVDESFHLVEQVLPRLPQRTGATELRLPVGEPTGQGIGWAEAAQGEVLYVVDLARGGITRCWPRSASFHNLSLFHEVFAGDVLTDFPFIEASFGLSIAGAVL